MNRRFAVVLFLLFTIAACDYPWWSSDNIKITATFRPDGSCSFSVDGVMLSDGRYKQSNQFESGPSLMMAQSDEYAISCGFWGAEIPPVLNILIAVPKGSAPRPGNYEVSAGDVMTIHTQATAGVFFYERYSHPSFANGITGAQLMVTKGALVIDAVAQKPLLIDGHLSAVAQRRALGL